MVEKFSLQNIYQRNNFSRFFSSWVHICVKSVTELDPSDRLCCVTISFNNLKIISDVCFPPRKALYERRYLNNKLLLNMLRLFSLLSAASWLTVWICPYNNTEETVLQNVLLILKHSWSLMLSTICRRDSNLMEMLGWFNSEFEL